MTRDKGGGLELINDAGMRTPFFKSLYVVGFIVSVSAKKNSLFS